MKGVVLAGGLGTRLLPLTRITNKHLLPVLDRPMIYYPLQTLINAGIKDILIVTGGPHAGDFLRLLGNGGGFGLTHLNNWYLRRGELACEVLEGWWTDAGTMESLHRAGNLVAETGANRVDGPATHVPPTAA